MELPDSPQGKLQYSKARSQEVSKRSFLSFVDPHVPEGRLRWKGVSIPRAVPKYLENTQVTVLQEYFARKWEGKL